MTNWKTYKLGELCSTVIDHRGKTPLKLGGDWSTEGYRALSAKNIKTGQIVQEDTIRFVDESLYRRWMKEEITRGDIIITSEAPFGEVYYWDSDEKIVLSQRLFGLKINSLYNSKYIYYYMRTHNFQEELRGRATGTTVVGLRQPELLKCKIALPSLEEQRRIAGILSAIDDKIENNRRINNNLEQQAQALYKQWFVDNRSADWKEQQLGEIALLITDGVHNTVIDSPEGEYYLLSCKNIKSGQLFIGSNERRIDHETFTKLRKRTRLSQGDILVTSVGTVGEMYLVNESPTNYEFQRSVAIIKPNQDIISSYFLYAALLYQRNEIKHLAHGAVQQCIFISDLKEYSLIVPDKGNITAFDSVVIPMFDKITKLQKENETLATLRDTLLPKLMNGEIKL